MATVSDHRFPLTAILLTVAADLVLLSLPYLTAWPDKPIAPATYLLCFGAALGVTILLAYLLRYGVTIESDRILIRAFDTTYVRFDEIVTIDAGTPFSIPPASLRCVLLLADGTQVKLSGMLTGFNDLVEALSAKTGKPISPQR